MPDGSILFPRDDEIATRSADLLFLARVLTVFPKGHAMLNVYRDSNKDFFCLIEDSEGHLYNPVSGEMREDPGHTVHQRIKNSTIRKYFRKIYFPFRKAALGRIETDKTIHINGIEIFQGGMIKKAGLDILNGTLRWKLGDVDLRDTFVDHLLREYNEVIDPERHDAICPFDGAVQSITGIVRSPERTWDLLCGREYELALCPHCLGYFGSRLGKMN